MSQGTGPKDSDRRSLGILGSHPSIIELFDAIDRAARLDAAVVIWGPTGAGKEVVARALHRLSKVRDGPFCAVNVAALPEGLIESELFGAVRGAFTGAIADRAGLVESARGGSLFLDEAGDLPLAFQPKLLRLLEQGEIRRVGSTKTIAVNFRVLVALQTNPAELRHAGRWRDDLYYRLASVILRVPALAERRSDIPELAQAFLARQALPSITSKALQVLQEHDWPGNVRELQQTLVRAAFCSDGQPIDEDHVREALTSGVLLSSFERPRTLFERSRTLERPRTLRAARLQHVRHIVASFAGDTQRAAEVLGISRRHVYRLLQDAFTAQHLPHEAASR